MIDISCPNCGEVIHLEDGQLDSVMLQIRDAAFEAEVSNRVDKLTDRLVEKAIQSEQSASKEREDALQQQIRSLEKELLDERTKAANFEVDKLQAVRDLEHQLQDAKTKYELELEQQKSQVEYYKDLKTRMSTKMVGETLEQHCLTQFNQIRMAAFPNAYFEKDNDAKSGSKGDFIYREELDGVELLSIMFEMKNEMDTTVTKHRNEDFFKELDKDRREKHCEYAILVSLLESDSELYNAGIVDVSYRYPKMYVIRPQFFIPVITFLRNTSMHAMDARRELVRMQNMNLDVTKFESDLLGFRDKMAKNYDLASRQFDAAIDEIDKTIEHLQKVKKNLQSSERNLRLLNDKAADLSIRKLTKDNPTMLQTFLDAGVDIK